MALHPKLAAAVALLHAAFALACAAQSDAPGEIVVPPHLVIMFEGGLPPSSSETPAALEGVSGRLRLGSATAPAHLDFAAWPPARAEGGKPRIDVRMRKKARLFGMRSFSLRDPTDVAFQGVPIRLEQLRREGVLATRILFVRVSLGGADLGMMAVTEHLSKELPESQRRREGVLFRLRREDLPVARIDGFDAAKIADSKQLSIERDTAAGLLQAFLNGDLPARDVFDEEVTARFLAVAELWQADAWLRPQSLRFYFNPVTQRIEPVASSDGLKIPLDPGARLVSVEGWPAQLLADADLRAAMLRNLHRIAGAMTSGELPRWVAAEEEGVLRELRPELAGLPAIDLGPWIVRARRLEALGNADLVRGPEHAVDDRSAGRDRLIAAPDVASRPRNPIPTASLDEVLGRHPYLEWDASQRVLRAAPGVWEVSGSLVLPEGVGLDLVAGTTLRFGEDEMLLSSGPLRFRGSAADPVVLEGLPAEVGAGTWQGLVVLRSEAPHVWDHVLVRNTTGIDRDGWRLTGGVSIRVSQARIDNSSFAGNRAEDAVNLMRSGFEFRGVSIDDARSDAFDCDFCEGSVQGGHIADVGGDGIDVSGSVVRVDGVVFERIGDKAISVGEGSHLVARGVDIREAGTAVAGKDSSEVIFEDSQVSGVRHAVIMAYTKKHEYGPARVSARNIRMARSGRAAVAQHGSRIDIDGVEQPTEDVDVEALYERGYMKK